MIPEFHIFGKEFSAYMIMALIGILSTLCFLLKLAKKNSIDVIEVESLFLISFVGVIIGSHLMCGVGNYQTIILLLKNIHQIRSLKQLLNTLVLVFGGSVFYGGLLGAILVGFIYIKKKKLDSKLYFDIGALAIPLFHFFGRIGCFLSGCCYGIECRYGVIYHYSIVNSANGAKRFPVQLVEALFNICLFLVFLYLFNKKKKQGKLIYIYLISYSIVRFLLEYLRGDYYRGFIGSLSYLQILSLIIALTASAKLVLECKKNMLRNI